MTWSAVTPLQFRAWVDRYPRELERQVSPAGPTTVCYFEYDGHRPVIVAEYNADSDSDHVVRSDLAPIFETV